MSRFGLAGEQPTSSPRVVQGADPWVAGSLTLPPPPGQGDNPGSTSQGTSHLPVVSVRIPHPAHTPSIRLVLHRPDHLGSRVHRPGKDLVGRRNGQDHAHGASTERWRTEVLVRRGLVGEPERGPVDRQARNHPPLSILHSKQFLGAERLLVKLDGTSTPLDAEEWGDCGLETHAIQVIVRPTLPRIRGRGLRGRLAPGSQGFARAAAGRKPRKPPPLAPKPGQTGPP